MQEEAPLIAFSMFEIRQSRNTKHFVSFGSWFWHILFLLEDFWWIVTQSSFPPFLRGTPRQSSMSSYTRPSNGRVGEGCILCREYFNCSRSPTSLMTLSACGDIDTIKNIHPCEGQRAYEGGKKKKIKFKEKAFDLSPVSDFHWGRRFLNEVIQTL